MAKYDIYAIGNALVDSEYTVDDQKLEQVGVDKGAMTLIDLERRTELLSHFEASQAKKASGGSAANTLIAAAQMGSKCFYSCKVADDDLGHFYMNDLEACDVDTNSNHVPKDAGTTGTCLVLITPDAQRSMSTYLGATADLSKNELVPQSISDSKYLYIEGYLAASPTGCEAVTEARKVASQAGVKQVITLSDVNMVKFCREGLDGMIGDGVDLLFSNEDEIKLMYDTQDLDEAAEKVKSIAKQFVITLGAEGAMYFDGQNIGRVEADKVEAIDTNGAGDMFAGAVLHALGTGETLEAACKLGCKASGELVKHFGPRLPADATVRVLESAGMQVSR